MKRLRLTTQQAEILMGAIEGDGRGFARADLRRLDRIQSTVERGAGTYVDALDAIKTEAQQQRSAALELDDAARAAELARVAQREQDRLGALVAGLGQEEIALVLDDADFAFLRERFERVEGWMGQRAIRRVVLALEDALAAAEDVEVLGDQVVPATAGAA